MQFAATHHRPLSAHVRLRADVRRTILTDEAVSFEFTLVGLEPRTMSAVVLQELAPSGWIDHSTIWTPPQQPSGSGRVRLHAGSTAIRCRLSSFDNRAKPAFTPPLPVDTREAPRILILLSMGGAWTGAPPTPPGNPNAQAVLADHGIKVDEARCRLRGISSELIRTLTTNRNVQCNDLCDENCTNFLEHLGLRLMNDESLASELKSIRNSGYCNRRSNDEGLANKIVVGKWENSELEPVRPAGIRTWEDILDEYHADGGRHVILVGQSHGCAKFAGMTRDHWRWGNDLSVDLFVSWDGADLGGGVSSVGDVPKTVLAFYQRDDLAHWQNGQHIEQATEEHELTKLLSHNAIARSAFVHDKTTTFIRDTVSSVRGKARGGDVATYKIDADGSLGERIELRRLSADLSLTFASRLGETSYLHFLAHESGRAITRRIDDHGMLAAVASEATLSRGLTAATSFTIGDSALALLASADENNTAIRRLGTDGSIGPRVYPGTIVEQASSLLKGTWDQVCAFRAGNRAFVALAGASENLRIVRLQTNGRPEAVVSNPAGVFGLGRLMAIASYTIGASTFMFTFGDGQSVYRMNDDGSRGSRVWHEAPPLAQITVATVVAHLRVGTAQSLLLLDALGGLHIRRIAADGKIGETLYRANIARIGRQSIATYVIDGVGYLLVLTR
ncbi:MAG: hypothetical protein ACXWXZ_06965 [Candidatus Binatia bacterium]